MQKQKQQQDANADAAAGIKKKKVTAAQLRVQKGKPSHDHTQIHNTEYNTLSAHKSTHPLWSPISDLYWGTDLSELQLPSTMRTEFPDPDDTLNFTLTIDPDEGMYNGGRFHFTFAIPQSFPHEAPKVKCTQKIYHPNIDLEGNVCLNILREDWKPVLNLQAVIVGLQVSAMLLDSSSSSLFWEWP
jgi:ubiquitin-conjugating enzyme E2 M